MLLHLPNELLLAIASHIDDEPTLRALACTSPRLYTLVLPIYYRKLAKARRCDPLVAAAVHGNLRAVKTLLEQGCSARGGGRPYKAKQIFTYIMKKVFSRGEAPTTTNPTFYPDDTKEGYQKYARPSALIAAIEKRREDIACLVLAHGADPNAQAGKIGHALEAACNEGLSEVVRSLLVHGADVCGAGGPPASAVYIASQKGFKEVVEVLLDHGVDAGAWGGREGHALRVAAVKGHMECVRLMVESGVDVNCRTEAKGRALEGALEAGHGEIARFLIERGAEDKLVEGVDDKWMPGAAFNIVSKEKGTKWRDVLDTLLERMDYSSQLAGNAFVSVARDGNEQLVEHFLRKGVDIEKHGSRALGVAAVKGHLNLLQRLVSAGVDVNQEVPKRGHAILRAAKHGYVECVRFLLENGASPNVVHGTPYTENRGWSRAVFCSTPLQNACWGEDVLSAERRAKFDAIARMLLEAGADPNVSGARWFHPLNLAAYRGNEAIVRLLLEHGSDPSYRGPVWGDNALQAAVMRRSISIARLLLEHGAKIDGSGALQAACGAVYPNEGHFEMAKLLLDYGADPNDKSEAFACTGYINAMSGRPGTSFWSALSCARSGSNRRNHNEGIIKLLLDRGAREED
ncbi:Ankyrin repeat and SOCS box [Paraconiothyrium brasiliense]|uniref:Ankyrin repeat and SOCS box n=1 Tax=Paraconiothyrium brasiliense TaxID=300254 RepID=A0ABR3RDC7_9PLEO